MGGPRSNYSRLPQTIRSRILFLRHDGAEYGEIRTDAEVMEACRKRGISLNNATFSSKAFKRDLADFSARARIDEEARRADKIAQSVLETGGALEDVTDVMRYELARNLRAALSDLSDTSGLTDESRIKALRSLAQSVTAISSQRQENRIAELQRKLEEHQKTAEAAESEWKVREAELLLRIAELEGGSKAAAGMSAETLSKVEEKIKLL